MSGQRGMGFGRINRYQRKMLFLILLPAVLICAGLSAYILYFQKELTNAVLYASQPVSLRLIDKWIWVSLAVVWLFFFFMLSWAFKVSGRLLGGIHRLIAELDEIIASKRRRFIRCRQGEPLMEDLVRRINSLIERF